MKISKAKEVQANVPVNAPVVVKLSNHSALSPQLRGSNLIGFWLGVKPNPKVSPALLDQLNGWHWIAEIGHSDSDVINDVHLEVIESVTIQ